MNNYFKKYKKSIFLIISLSIIVSSIPVINIILKQEIIDAILSNSMYLNQLFYIFLIIIIFLYIMQILNTYIKEKYLINIRLDILNDLLAGIVSIKALNFLSNKDNDIDLNTILNQYMEPTIENYFSAKIDLLVTISISIFAYFYAFTISWIIAIYSIIFMIICYYTNKYGGILISKITIKNGEISTNFINNINNLLENFRIIKTYHIEEKIQNIFNKDNMKYTQSYLNLKNKMASYNTLSAIIYLVQKIGIILLGAYLYYFNIISSGEFVSVIFLSTLLSAPIIQISSITMRIKSITDVKNKLEYYIQGEQNKNNSQDELIMNNTLLKYENLNLEIQLGKKYLIIGKNGSGKSTLLKKILKDKIANNDYYDCGIVFQNDTVFDTSICENINIFDSKYNSEIEKMIIKYKLNKNHNSIISKEENNISGGEQQKILLLRLLFNNRNFLLLDEAFSSIDMVMAENLIYDLLKTDKTILMTSHHIEKKFLDYFDYVVFLDNEEIRVSSNKDVKEQLYEAYIQGK